MIYFNLLDYDNLQKNIKNEVLSHNSSLQDLLKEKQFKTHEEQSWLWEKSHLTNAHRTNAKQLFTGQMLTRQILTVQMLSSNLIEHRYLVK